MWVGVSVCVGVTKILTIYLLGNFNGSRRTSCFLIIVGIDLGVIILTESVQSQYLGADLNYYLNRCTAIRTRKIINDCLKKELERVHRKFDVPYHIDRQMFIIVWIRN